MLQLYGDPTVLAFLRNRALLKSSLATWTSYEVREGKTDGNKSFFFGGKKASSFGAVSQMLSNPMKWKTILQRNLFSIRIGRSL